MSGFSASAPRTVPQTGNEISIKFQGDNTSYFSGTPERDLEIKYLVRVVSPIGSEFSVPTHWHPKTDEYFCIFTGEIEVELNGVKRRVTPGDGEVCIPRYARHSIHSSKNMYTELGERADPDPIKKMRFLQRLISNGGQKEDLGAVQTMRIFYEDGDCYPSTGWKILDVLMVYFLGGFLGSFLGLGNLPDSKGAKAE